MKKKIVSKVFALLLAACTVLSACGNESGNQSVGQTDKSETNDTVQEGEEPYTIVYAFDVWVQQADWDLVEENLSNIVYDKIGAKVKLLPMTGANYQQEVNLMITSGEKLDLVNASARTTFSSDVTSNKLLGLDEDPFYELKKMAQEYGKDYDLAIELWKEDIRECKILATLIMPADKMLAEITDIWMEQVQSQEMAEMLAFNLLQYVEYAPVIAYQWIASNKPLYEIAGFQLLARLFANGKEPNDRGINEFLDQAAVALQGENMGVKHAAANAVMRFCDFGEDFEKIAQGALKGIFEI